MFRTKKSTSIGSQKVLHLGLKEDPQGPDKGHRKRFRNFGTIKPVDKLVAYIPVGLKKGEQRALLTVRHFEVQTSMTLWSSKTSVNHAFAGIIIQQAGKWGPSAATGTGTKRPRAQKTLSFSEFTDYIIEHKCRCEKDPVAPSKHFEGLGGQDLLWNYLETRDANKMIPIYQGLLTRIRFSTSRRWWQKYPEVSWHLWLVLCFFSRFLKRDQLTYPWRIRCAYNIDMFLELIHHVVSSFWWMLVMWTFIRHVLKITSNEETLIRRLRLTPGWFQPTYKVGPLPDITWVITPITRVITPVT